MPALTGDGCPPSQSPRNLIFEAISTNNSCLRTFFWRSNPCVFHLQLRRFSSIKSLPCILHLSFSSFCNLCSHISNRNHHSFLCNAPYEFFLRATRAIASRYVTSRSHSAMEHSTRVGNRTTNKSIKVRPKLRMHKSMISFHAIN